MPISVNDAIYSRHSKRSFLSAPVQKTVIKKILMNAANAPSSKNTQPWGVAVLQGELMQTLSRQMCQKFDEGVMDGEDYCYSKDPMPDHFKARARACGYALFDLKGIERTDKAQRVAHNKENFVFFNAPIVLIIHMDQDSERGNFLDCGCFIQNILLGAVGYGLGACPQFSICAFSDTIRGVLKLPESRMVVCGISMGYPDDHIVNTFVPDRLPLDKFVTWHD